MLINPSLFRETINAPEGNWEAFVLILLILIDVKRLKFRGFSNAYNDFWNPINPTRRQNYMKRFSNVENP